MIRLLDQNAKAVVRSIQLIIEIGVNLQAKENDLDFSGQVDQVQVPNIDFAIGNTYNYLNTCHVINRFP